MAAFPGVVAASVAAISALPALAAQPVRGEAGNYPFKPVRWVVGFTPGASNDVIARTLGARLAEAWGQQVIIDNRPGASGMIGGQIDGMITSAASAEAVIRSNRVRVLAVAGPKRVPLIPDVPTLAESGITDGDSLVWFGMAAPAKTPRDVIRKLNAGVNQALAIAEVQRRLSDLGMEIVGGPPEAAAKFVRDEAGRIRGLVKAGVLVQE